MSQWSDQINQGKRDQAEWDYWRGQRSSGTSAADVPLLGGLIGPPPRIGERPQQYDPNAASFDLGMPGGAENWQNQLGLQSAYWDTRGQQAANQAEWGQGQFRGLANRSAEDYGRATGAWEQGQGALGLFRGAAEGNAPSVAELQQQQGLQQAMANQRAMAASGPYNPAAGLMAQQNAAQMQGQAVGQAGMLRANEMAQARGQYAGMLGQQQQGAQGLAGMTQAQQAAYANYLQGQRQFQLGAGQQALGLQQEVRNVGAQQQQGQMGYEQIRSQQALGAMGANEARLEANQRAEAEQRNSMVGMGAAAIGALAMASDEASKMQLQSAQQEISNLRAQLGMMSAQRAGVAASGGGSGSANSAMMGMNIGQLLSDERAKRLEDENKLLRSWMPALGANGLDEEGNTGSGMGSAITAAQALRGLNSSRSSYETEELGRVPSTAFRYKPEARSAFPSLTAPGQRYGVTAQDLERAGPVGRSLVRPGPGGLKTIDVPQATGTLLAAVGQQEREIEQLKRQRPAVNPSELNPPGWDDWLRSQLDRSAVR